MNYCRNLATLKTMLLISNKIRSIASRLRTTRKQQRRSSIWSPIMDLISLLSSSKSKLTVIVMMTKLMRLKSTPAFLKEMKWFRGRMISTCKRTTLEQPVMPKTRKLIPIKNNTITGHWPKSKPTSNSSKHSLTTDTLSSYWTTNPALMSKMSPSRLTKQQRLKTWTPTRGVLGHRRQADWHPTSPTTCNRSNWLQSIKIHCPRDQYRNKKQPKKLSLRKKNRWLRWKEFHTVSWTEPKVATCSRSSAALVALREPYNSRVMQLISRKSELDCSSARISK